MKKLKILIGAGGTGGHLFPAIAVMERIKELSPESEFYFTGRRDKIEGSLIPKMGFHFLPIDVDGFAGLSLISLSIPFKIFKAKMRINKLIKKEGISAVICTGAYISYAPGIAAKANHIPLFLLESNVNPGKTISLLAKYSDIIFTSFPNTINFFNPKYQKRVVYSGNPLRKFFDKLISKEEALNFFNLDTKRKTIFIFGGSLGARSINNAVESQIDNLVKLDLNIIWQTGKSYQYNGTMYDNLYVTTFIDDMNIAYSAADLVVSRSGATTVAELAILGKPSILIPLPSASNNEQYLNAKILSDNRASILIEDSNLKFKLFETIKNLIFDEVSLRELSINTKQFAHENAADIVARHIIKYLDDDGSK